MIVNILKSYARVCNAKSVVPLPPSLALPERSSATEAAEMADNPKRNVKGGREHVQELRGKEQRHGAGVPFSGAFSH